MPAQVQSPCIGFCRASGPAAVRKKQEGVLQIASAGDKPDPEINSSAGDSPRGCKVLERVQLWHVSSFLRSAARRQHGCAAYAWRMQPLNTDWIPILIKLITGCRRGQQGYSIASRDAEDADLRYLFSSYALQRAKFIVELEEALSGAGILVGAQPAAPVAGEGWFGREEPLAEWEDRDILLICLRGEEEVLQLYLEAEQVDGMDQIRGLVSRQRADLEVALCRLGALRLLSEPRDAQGF